MLRVFTVIEIVVMPRSGKGDAGNVESELHEFDGVRAGIPHFAFAADGRGGIIPCDIEVLFNAGTILGCDVQMLRGNRT